MSIIKKIKAYFLCVFVLSLFGSLGTAFAADVWMVEIEDTYTYQVTYFESDADIDVRGEFIITIEDIDSDDLLTYSVDFDENLEDNDDWYNYEDTDNLETYTNVYVGFLSSFILCMDLYDVLDFEDFYADMEEEVEVINDEGYDVTIRGSSNEKSYDITISGEDDNGEEIESSQKLDWGTDGVLKESSTYYRYTDAGDEYEFESTFKLKSFSIPGFSLGFFGIAMVLGVTSLLLLRKRMN